jgi:transposase
MYGRSSEVREVPSRFEIDDELWAEVEPLIPVRARRGATRAAGHCPIAGHSTASLRALHTGIAWEDLPQEYGYGSEGDLLAATA